MSEIIRNTGNLSLADKLAVVGALTALTLSACGGDNNSETKSTTPEIGIEGSETNDAVPVTDEILAEGNFACGGKLDVELNGGVSKKDFGYKMDFFQANEELGESIIDITSTDSDWGMGQAAFDFALENMYVNSTTIESSEDVTTNNEVLDKLVSGIFSITLEKDRVFVNGDCRKVENQVSMPSPDIPLIDLKAGSTVEAILLPLEKKNELLELMQKDVRGNINFAMEDFILSDGTKVIAVYLFANGCDNPIRIKTPEPEVPTTTTTTTSTTTPPTVTTTIPPKNDDGKLPDTGIPADQDPGTPDVPGEGPAGQTPNEEGYIPTETPPSSQAPDTTQLPAPVTAPNTVPATTGAAPTSTNPPVVAPSNPTPSAPETGTLPAKP